MADKMITVDNQSNDEAARTMQEITVILDEANETAVNNAKKTGGSFLSVHHGALIPLPAEYDEVYPGITIGGESLAKDVVKLKAEKFTHIINCAQGKKFSQVDTDASFYAGTDMKYFGIPGHDSVKYDITPYFKGTADFIENALFEQGKVYVHCHQGVSRSSVIVLAYLMIKKHLRVQEALKTVLCKRCVRPNHGFLKRLIQLNMQLFRIS